MKLFVATLLLVASPSAAAAVTLDFEDLATGNAGTTIIAGDYRLTSEGNFNVLTTSGSKAVVGPNPFDFSRSPLLTLARADGAAFRFTSLDVFAADSNGLGVPITFRVTPVVGAPLFFFASTPEFGNGASIPATRTTIVFPTGFPDLSSVSWSNGAEFHQFDNLVVETVAAGVPEPANWAMLLVGFGLAGAAVRRRRAVPRAVA